MPPTVSANAGNAGGNLSPTAPGLSTSAAAGNSAPTAPGATVGAPGGNLSPTAPGLSSSASAGNRAPTAPGSNSGNSGGDLCPDLPRPLGQVVPPQTRYLRIVAKFAPHLSDDGLLIQGGSQINSRPFYTTNGEQYPAVDGVWAKAYYNGTTWVFEIYYNGTVKARWIGPTAAYATPNLVGVWTMTLDPTPDYPTSEWAGITTNYFSMSLVTSGVQVVALLNPSWSGETLSYYAPVDGRAAYADAATFNGTSWEILAISIRWVEEDETHGRHWKLSDPDDTTVWRGHQDVATPDQVTVWERDGASGFPLILAEAGSPESISGDAAGNSAPTAPGLSKSAAGGNLAPSAPGAIA